MKTRTVSKIIKDARGAENQAVFANRLGVSQASISKYEKGLASPPMNIMNKCLEIIHNVDNSDVSLDVLVNKLKKLNGPEHFYVRKVIESMLNAVKI